jgi:hypothetical protein
MGAYMSNVLTVAKREYVDPLLVVVILFAYALVPVITLYNHVFLADGALFSNEETKVIT